MTQDKLNNNEEKVERKPRKTTRNTTKKTTTRAKTEQKKETKKITRENKKGELKEKKENKKDVVQVKKENKRRTSTNNIFKKSKLKIIPLGGLHEVGKNITVFEYENEIIVVDCGLSFPEDDMLGVDLVIPDITYLQRNVDKIKGLIITHGHEDHIGSVPYILKQINIPVYAPKLAMGLIRNKLEEHRILRSSTLVEVTQGQKVKFGKNFEVEFIRSTHSIPDSVMLAINTPVGTILHTSELQSHQLSRMPSSA